MTDLERGREAFARHGWTDACAALSAADHAAPLEPDDLERLSTAQYLVGRDAESAASWARTHHAFLSRGDVPRAVRCAFWLAFGLLHAGNHARGGAWLARAARLLDRAGHDSVERGYLLLPVALRLIGGGDPAAAYTRFCEAAEIGDRYGDDDLVALARHSRGRCLLRMDRIDEGIALLDEAMVAIEAGEVSPLVVGDVYCSVIEGCMEIFDLRRAQEWTAALTQWCARQPDLVPYSGECLVRRAEILQLHGAWTEAIDAADQACARFLQGPPRPATGAALYQRAELHRLRGEAVDAEAAYLSASRWGRLPQPGLALLRLARGQVEIAAAAIRPAIDAAASRASRLRLLPAHVEIALAAGDIAAARATADELTTIADALPSLLFRAVAAQARGAVLLAEGDATAALATLRQAWSHWQEVECPYEAARVRVLIGTACRALGDTDAAEMEVEAARWAFQQVGARPDLVRLDALSRPPSRALPGGITARELQVLRLVASGKTNAAIAADLFISERTVERHVSNIFTKVDVPSRAAATAWAYEHQLV